MAGRPSTSRRVVWLVVGCALALAGTAVWKGFAPAFVAAGLAAAGPGKVAIFGIDAADWNVIDPLIAAGYLPTFARLKRVGSTGVMRSTPPLLSPIIWTTMATGREPEDHGVLDFMADTAGGGQMPVDSGARRVKAIWEIWSEANRSVLVTGWWATWPADPVRGVLVSDRLATPHLKGTVRPAAGLVYPASRWSEISRWVVEPESLEFAALAKLLPLTAKEFGDALAAERQSTSQIYRSPVAHFRAALAATRSYRRISTELIRSVQPDLWAAYYELVDTTSHLFIRDKIRGEAAIRSAYIEMDSALADAARQLDPTTLVVVVSDHGFQPADAAIREDPADLTSGATAWHRPYGIVAATSAGALAGASPPPRASPLGTMTPLDLVPTLLAYAGLPVARDMDGRIVTAMTGEAGASAPRIASYGEHKRPADSPTLDSREAKDELDRLRALGYITGGAVSSLGRVNLGEILYRKGDFRGAQRELEAVLRADPINERASLWLARSYAALGRSTDAVRIYDGLFRIARSSGRQRLDPIVVLAATDLDLAAGRVDAAAARLARAPAGLKQTPEVLTAQGALSEAQGRTAAAEREYRAAIEATPTDAEALSRLTDLLLRASRTGEALALTARLARAYPSSSLHLSLAGEASLADKRYGDAARYLEAALKLAPETASIRLELARVRLVTGRPGETIELLSGLAPSREVGTLRGAALAARGEWIGAIDAFDQALSAGEPSTDLLNALGNAQLRAGRPADAVRTLERSLTLKADQPLIRDLLENARKQVR